VFLLLGKISLGRGALVAVALCSPSVMFAIERANLDIVVFTLMVAAVLLWRTGPSWAQAISPIVVLIGATAKIYPVFGLPAYLFLRRRIPAIAASLCVVAFAAYAVITLSDIQAVARVAPQGQHHAFGARILPVAIYHLVVPDRWQGGLVSKQALVILPALAIGVVIWFLGRRLLPPADEAAETATRLAFFLGALIFLGTFAVGNNFDYRLVFTLLTLPQLFEWATEERGASRSRLAGVSIVALLVLLWIGALSEPLRLGDEVVTWAFVGLMIALLGASVPRFHAIWSALRQPTTTSV
jgi:Glycosyltransferase family 87